MEEQPSPIPPFLPLVQVALVKEGDVESAAAISAVSLRCLVRVRKSPPARSVSITYSTRKRHTEVPCVAFCVLCASAPYTAPFHPDAESPPYV